MLQQLSVFVENEIGSLAKITTVLKQNNINIKAFAAFDSPDFGILRIIVDKPDAAKQILSTEGFAVKNSVVIGVELKDQPGDLDNVLNIIAEEGLSLNYIYSFVLRKDNAPLMVMNINNMEKAIAVLKSHDVKVIE